MRNPIAVLAAAAVLAACEGATPTSPAEPAAFPPPRMAVVDNESVPTTLFVFVPCAAGGAGELIEVSGNLHIVFSITVNRNSFHVKEHFQPQGISGFGLTTGAKYQATGVTQDDFRGSFINGSFQSTSVNNFRMIGQGPGNNFAIHETVHVTFNANGILTSSVDNFSVTCK